MDNVGECKRTADIKNPPDNLLVISKRWDYNGQKTISLVILLLCGQCKICNGTEYTQVKGGHV